MSRRSLIRNLGRASGLFCGLTLLLFAGTAAARPHPWATSQQLMMRCCSILQQVPVEQQSPNYVQCGAAQGPIYCPFTPDTWVYNPTAASDPFVSVAASPACIWDVDDYTDGYGAGSLAAGTTVTNTVCAFADDPFNGYPQRRIQARVDAPVRDLVVRMTDTLGGDYQAAVEPDGSGFVYRICVTQTYPGPFPVVAGSNGGVGIPVLYTLTVTNPSKKRAQDVTVMQQAWSAAPGEFPSVC